MNYLPGVMGLARSLSQVQASQPLYVALSANVPPHVDALLQGKGMHPLRLPVKSPLPQVPDQKQHHWTYTFDKLHLFGLTQFDKLVYLDSDMMVLENIDELFDKPHMSAVAAGRLIDADWTGLNSGLMVIEPKEGLSQSIGAMLQPALDRARAAGRSEVGDQDLINVYYAEWPNREELHLDDGYNVLQYHTDAYIDKHNYCLPWGDDGATQAKRKPIKVMHFAGRDKPWMTKAVAKHLLHSFKPGAPRWERKAFSMYRKLLAQPQGMTVA